MEEDVENIEFSLRFGGFYCSTHSDIIDMMINDYYDLNDEFERGDGDINADCHNEDNINYDVIHMEYASRYVDVFNEWFEEETGDKINLVFKSIWSPKFYNFETDEIMCIINKDILDKFKSEVKRVEYAEDISDYNYIYEFIDNKSKSRPGFVSFYNGIDEVLKDDAIFASYFFDYFVHELDESMKIWEEESSGKLCEFLYSIDFEKEDLCKSEE